MVLDNERVIESYNYIVEQGGGREQWVLGETERFIIDSNMPGVVTEQKDVSPGFLGEKRKFLIVRHVKYREYRMFIGARSFGEHLDASWFLAVDPGFFKRTVSKHTTGNPTALSQRLDIFAQQDIKAFKTVSDHCFKRALHDGRMSRGTLIFSIISIAALSLTALPLAAPALALSRLTGIPLYHFKCAWFDDAHYFDFYPRAVVEKRGGQGH